MGKSENQFPGNKKKFPGNKKEFPGYKKLFPGNKKFEPIEPVEFIEEQIKKSPLNI